MKARPRTLVPLRGHDGLLSRHGVKMASKGHYSSYDVCSRVDWTREVERASGDEGSGGQYLSHPPEKAAVGIEDEGENDSEGLKV